MTFSKRLLVCIASVLLWTAAAISSSPIGDYKRHDLGFGSISLPETLQYVDGSPTREFSDNLTETSYMFKAAIYLYESEDYGIITLKILLRRRADNKPVDISDVKIHHGKTINTMSSGKSKIIWYDPSPSESKGSAFFNDPYYESGKFHDKHTNGLYYLKLFGNLCLDLELRFDEDAPDKFTLAEKNSIINSIMGSFRLKK